VPAKLCGYKRVQVLDAPYPAIIEAEDHTVDGLLLELDNYSQLNKLDLFETDMYRRITVQVLVGNAATDAFAYLWNRDMELLIDQEWDYDYFVKHLLPFWTDLNV
jgi:gamma-glutamylcyclotransferase (GGCT)/AIG2-like uncharacterized protein YtfP